MNKKKSQTTPKLMHPTQVELAEMLAKARKEAEEAIYRVENIKGKIQEIIDEANVTNPVIPFIQPQETEGLINIWSSVFDQVSQINRGLGNIYPSTDSASGTATMSTTTITRAYTNDMLITNHPEFPSVWNPYVEFVSRPSQKEDVIQLLKEFGLDIAHQPNEKSPLELFETAHKAYERPVTQNNPIATSLIPLRGGIENAVQSLLLARSQQEETKGWKRKITSIGKQLKKASRLSSMD